MFGQFVQGVIVMVVVDQLVVDGYVVVVGMFQVVDQLQQCGFVGV